MRVRRQRLAVSSGRCLNHELHEPKLHPYVPVANSCIYDRFQVLKLEVPTI